MSPTHRTHRRGAAASQNQPPALLSLTLRKSLQLQDLGISWQPQALSPLTWHPTKGIKGLGSRGHHSALRSFCPFLSIPCLPTKKLRLLPVQCPESNSSPRPLAGRGPTAVLRQKDERSHPQPKHSPWLPSPQYLAPAPSSRLWLASVSRPAGWPCGQAKAEDWPPPYFCPQPLPRQRCAAAVM